MKMNPKTGVLALVAATAATLLTTASAETPAATATPEQVLALVKQVQAQQTAIAENQAKIDAKLAAVIEAVRVARLYSSRGGK